MSDKNAIQSAAQDRITKAIEDIQKTLLKISEGRPLDAEPDKTRKADHIAELLSIERAAAVKIAESRPLESLALPDDKREMAEALQGDTVDYQPVTWLQIALKASTSVVRLLERGVPMGSGFMVSRNLLLTNNHVIGSSSDAAHFQAEFGYEDKLTAPAPEGIRYNLDPARFFETQQVDDLDYTLVALGQPVISDSRAHAFAYCPLSGSPSKHIVGGHVNVIQHPKGSPKLIVFRENRIVHRGDHVLHYVADTEPGASGSPVFNDLFQVVALHHWGAPHREIVDANGKPLRRDFNEGIRISAIVRDLRQRESNMNAARRRLLQDAIDDTSRGPQGLSSKENSEGVQSMPSHSIFMVSALESAEKAVPIDPDYDSRKGYDESFLGRDFPVPLPKLKEKQLSNAARVAGQGDGSGSASRLDYHHFSIAMNARRKLAYFAAVNIDGYSWKDVDRVSGRVRESAEAREKWYPDPRILPKHQTDDSLYLGQESRLFFQRGHLVRRQDPCWGPAGLAELANADTFHFTNCAPQASGFNDAAKQWLGLEDYALKNARNLRERISVISGPIFHADDPSFRKFQIPLLFFKIICRVEDGQLAATGFLADQSPMIEQMRKVQPGFEKVHYDWTDMPVAVEEKLAAISEIEELTGLDFGPLPDHDTFRGGDGRRAPLHTEDNLSDAFSLKPKQTKGARPKAAAAKRPSKKVQTVKTKPKPRRRPR